MACLNHWIPRPSFQTRLYRLGGLFQTCPRQASARAYQTSKQRAQDLPLWAHSYHWYRPHSGIKQQTPVGRLNLNQNNLVRPRR